jgi:hypothetical protein
MGCNRQDKVHLFLGDNAEVRMQVFAIQENAGVTLV